MIQQVVTAGITGDTGITFPTAESSVQTAFGLEYRRDELASVTDAAWAAGDAAGLNANIGTSGVTDVFEGYAEARIPIVEHLTGLDALPVDGFRFTAAPPKVRGMGTFPVRANFTT